MTQVFDESQIVYLAYLNADARVGIGANGKTSRSIDAAAFTLVGGGPGWSSALGVGFTVTYAYRADAPARMPDDTFEFERFNAAQIAQAELALRGWSDVANIRFVRIGTGSSGEAAYANSATILFSNYTSGVAGSSAFAFFPGNINPGGASGDVWVNSTLSYNTNPTVGNYGGQVIAHEIGHAIGLDHPSDYNASANQTLNYTTDASYFEDSRQYTIMSYFSESNTGGNFGGINSAAPMLDDIAAAQLEYGPNMSTRMGDTLYGFNSNADRPWFLAASGLSRLVFAVWDAGGRDTFDFSGYSSAQTIDLRPGNFSNVGGLIGNVSIAQHVDIENAIGGAGADQITGNALANLLQGGRGNDTLSGGDGADTLAGGLGADLMDGGAGADVARYDDESISFSWTRNTNGSWTVKDLRPASAASDILTSVEVLAFLDREIILIPNLPTAIESAFSYLTRASSDDLSNLSLAVDISKALSASALTPTQAIRDIIRAVASTTSVATLAYEFFTGKIPSVAGIDYLVSPTGPNPNNLNSPYYQTFSLENRYINFAVNLGKAGEGAAAFQAKYGALSVFEATRTAYATIFGEAPSDSKLHAILDPTTVLNGQTFTRADYFAYYGRDGADGIGTKAAMVGYLLAEAVKADVGVYALSNEGFLNDLADGASFGVDIIGVYSRPDFAYLGG